MSARRPPRLVSTDYLRGTRRRRHDSSPKIIYAAPAAAAPRPTSADYLRGTRGGGAATRRSSRGGSQAADVEDADLVVLSRGLHPLDDTHFSAQLKDTLHWLATHRHAPRGARVVVRGSHAVPADCTDKADPLEAPLPDGDAAIQRQNDIAKRLALSRGFAFLDVHAATALRPGARPAGMGPNECVHYCVPGPVDDWARSLAALWLEHADGFMASEAPRGQTLRRPVAAAASPRPASHNSLFCRRRFFSRRSKRARLDSQIRDLRRYKFRATAYLQILRNQTDAKDIRIAELVNETARLKKQNDALIKAGWSNVRRRRRRR